MSEFDSHREGDPFKLYNMFVFPWKVPSMNELLFSKGITNQKHWILRSSKEKKKNFQVFNMYNQTKQEWSEKVKLLVKHEGFEPVEGCHFNYLIVENTIKRDPSNIFASSIKFIEDGLIEAKVIPNDGWKNVFGIRSYYHLDRSSSCCVLLCMTNEPLEEREMIEYYEAWKEKSIQKFKSGT